MEAPHLIDLLYRVFPFTFFVYRNEAHESRPPLKSTQYLVSHPAVLRRRFDRYNVVSLALELFLSDITSEMKILVDIWVCLLA